MIPVSTLIGRIRTRYDVTGEGSSVRWSDNDIRGFINEGLESLAEATGFYERYCSFQIEAGRAYYDIRGFTPETVVGITSVWSYNRNDWIRPKAATDLDWAWEYSNGDPQVYHTRGIYWLVVYPIPQASSGILRVYFRGIPSRFTHTQAVLGDLPDDFYPALEDYALYEMSGQDGYPKRAILHFQSYLKREAKLKKFVDGREATADRSRRIGMLAGRIT